MKKGYFKPYDIDETYELETYRHVDRDYGESANGSRYIWCIIECLC